MFEKIINQLNRLFGIELSSDSTEAEVLNSLEKQKSIAESFSSSDSKITEIENSLAALKLENASLLDVCNSQLQAINTLKDSYEAQSQEISTLKTQITTLATDVNTVKLNASKLVQDKNDVLPPSVEKADNNIIKASAKLIEQVNQINQNLTTLR